MHPIRSPRVPGGDPAPAKSKLQSLVQSKKLDIQIQIARPQRFYTTRDRLDGVVSITAPVDTEIEDLTVELTGSTRTYVNRAIAASGNPASAIGNHQFLCLSQPNLSERFPENNIFKADRPRRFPFKFTIPHRVVPEACQHPVSSGQVRDEHLLLPPSLGDNMVGHENKLDDMVSGNDKIRYGVDVKVTRKVVARDGAVSRPVESKTLQIGVCPTVHELAPLHLSGQETEYILRQEKVVKKGLLQAVSGTLVVEATQPPALEIPSRNRPDDGRPKEISLTLRFDPTDASSDTPQMGNLNVGLRVCTFLSCRGQRSLPNEKAASDFDTQVQQVRPLKLRSQPMSDIVWSEHRPAAASNSEASDIPNPSSGYKGKSFFTAKLGYALSLPTNNRAFVPTFHSCLVSRTYQVTLALDFSSGDRGSIPSRLELQVPVQVVSPWQNADLPQGISALTLDNTNDGGGVDRARPAVEPEVSAAGNDSPPPDEQPPEYSPRTPMPGAGPRYRPDSRQ